MKVETPLVLTEWEDRHIHPGHEDENQCTYCGVGPLDPWYPIGDVSMVRHWKSVSFDEPGGGHWTWYCPAHLEHRDGNWWRYSHLAPAHLLPEEKHYCTKNVGLGKKCGERATEPFDGVWLCEEHAVPERMNRRIAELMSDDLDENELL